MPLSIVHRKPLALSSWSRFRPTRVSTTGKVPSRQPAVSTRQAFPSVQGVPASSAGKPFAERLLEGRSLSHMTLSHLSLTPNSSEVYSEERERRHFEAHNKAGRPSLYKPRGREYIPHGRSNESTWRPHPPHMEPEYTECGPDFQSRARYIPAPKDFPLGTSQECFPAKWPTRRYFPGKYTRTTGEYDIHPDQGRGIKTTFGRAHLSSMRSDNEIVTLGNAHVVMNQRNGLPVAAFGDKPYHAAEYEPGFHKRGSTRPVASFGFCAPREGSTHIPFIKESSSVGGRLGSLPRESFAAKEERKARAELIDDVHRLRVWRPATPLRWRPSKRSKLDFSIGHEERPPSVMAL